MLDENKYIIKRLRNWKFSLKRMLCHCSALPYPAQPFPVVPCPSPAPLPLPTPSLVVTINVSASLVMYQQSFLPQMGASSLARDPIRILIYSWQLIYWYIHQSWNIDAVPPTCGHPCSQTSVTDDCQSWLCCMVQWSLMHSVVQWSLMQSVVQWSILSFTVCHTALIISPASPVTGAKLVPTPSLQLDVTYTLCTLWQCTIFPVCITSTAFCVNTVHCFSGVLQSSVNITQALADQCDQSRPKNPWPGRSNDSDHWVAVPGSRSIVMAGTGSQFRVISGRSSQYIVMARQPV